MLENFAVYSRDGYVWHHVWPSKALMLSFGNCYSETLDRSILWRHVHRPLTSTLWLVNLPSPQPYWRLINHWFPFNKGLIKTLVSGGYVRGGSRLTNHHNWLFFVGVVDLGFHPIFDHIAGLKIQEGAYMFSIYGIYTCFTYTQILTSSSFKKKRIFFRIFSFNIKWI